MQRMRGCGLRGRWIGLVLAVAICAGCAADAPPDESTDDAAVAGTADVPARPADPLADPTGGEARLPEVARDGDAAAQFARARAALARARTADAPDEMTRAALDALAHLRLGLEADPDAFDEHEQYQQLAAALGARPFLDRLAAEYRSWFEANPDSPAFARFYASALLHARRPDEAQDVLAFALQRHPDDYWLNYQFGYLAHARGESAAARESLEHASELGLAQGRAGATRLLARVAADEGRQTAAIAVLEKLLVTARESATVGDYELLARAYADSGQAETGLDRLTNLLPGQLAAAHRNQHFRTLGYLYEKLGRLRPALQYYRDYLAFHSDAPDAPQIRARLHALLEEMWAD
jgi:hypothetical protein